MNNSSQLNRTLGLRLAVIMVIGNIIGSGVFKKVAPMATELHSPGWVLVCWMLGGIITLFGALSNAEIAGMLADTGGEYAYYKKIYNKFFSFLYGWSNFAAIKTAAVAGIAYVFAQSLHSIINIPPLLSSLADFNIAGIFYPFADFNVKFTAIILIVALTWLNSTGIKTGAGLSTALLLLLMAGIALIIVFGLGSSQSGIGAAFDLSTSNDTAITGSAIFTAMLGAFWAYEGWNSVGLLGGEIKNPHRNVPMSIILGLLLVITIYMLANIAYLSLLPVPQLEQINAAGNSIAAVEAVKVFWGQGGVMFMSILILVSTLGCTHATILSNARTYYAMAKEGVFFSNVSKLNSAQVPAAALWYQGVWACLLVLSGTFDQLTEMLIFAAFIYYGATTLGVFILRRRMPDAPRPYKTWGYPVIPAIFIIFCVLLIGNTIMQRPREAGIGLFLILLGIPFYWWFTKKKG
ncbi:MAG: amino acid permease [Chitinophagaceae bacterium]|nr:amino acid permease [Chitinophagaceae bacterium]